MRFDRTARMLVVLLAALVSAAALATPEGSGDKPGTGSGSKHADRPDPVKRNGTIFEDEPGVRWPQPKLALVFTGEQQGYIEPCGCAGLDNQLGGLKRRHTLLNQLAADGWPLVSLDTGGMVKRFGPQSQIKYRRAVESLITLGYAGVGLGTKELRLDLIGTIINFDEARNPITSANVGFFGYDELFSKRWRVVEQGGMRIGFTSVLADKEAAKLGQNDDITIDSAHDGLAFVAPKLAAENCDQQVLLVYGDAEVAKKLAQQFPQFDWVVAARGAQVPALDAREIEGTTSRLIEVGHKGQYAVVVGLYGDGAAKSFRYQKVPLDHRFDDSPTMQAMLTDYQRELQTIGLKALGAKELPHPTGNAFAGSAACIDCHEEEFDIWKGTPHSHATQTLVDIDPPRQFDPECLSCHATGWEPQQYFPFKSGFLGLKQTPHLNANGCENCHGPAAKHVAVENGDIEVTEEEQQALYDALHMEIAENEGNQEGQVFGAVVRNCMRCHDLDNSPDFDFQEYWPHVKHGGGDD